MLIELVVTFLYYKSLTIGKLYGIFITECITFTKLRLTYATCVGNN